MMVAAYELALNPTMSLNHFKSFVNVLRKVHVKIIAGNDIHLIRSSTLKLDLIENCSKEFFKYFCISGNHDGRTARNLIQAIDQAVTKKILNIFIASNFISILSDGSQARKTGDDKEMILTKTFFRGKLFKCSKFHEYH